MSNEHTKGEWKAFNMVHADHGGPMTPEEIGEYVKNSVIKSIENGGSAERFLFISTGEEGAPDIALVGNGPRGPANARLIIKAPELYALAERIAALTPATRDYSPGIGDGMLNQLIDEAKKLTSGIIPLTPREHL